VHDVHPEFDLPSANETVRVKEIDMSEIPAPVLAGEWHTANTRGKAPSPEVCPRICVRASDPGPNGISYYFCSRECAGHASYYAEVGPTQSQFNITTPGHTEVSTVPASITEKRDECDSLCRKYHCCQSETTCTCSPAQLADIEAGTLTVDEVLAAQDTTI
jgi:hypothetical protein